MNHIEALKKLIEREYATTARHVETVAVHETYEGETIWNGEVEVFEVPEFPNAEYVFAWEFDDDGAQQVTVAQIPPATTPENAVKSYIVSQYGKGN